MHDWRPGDTFEFYMLTYRVLAIAPNGDIFATRGGTNMRRFTAVDWPQMQRITEQTTCKPTQSPTH